MEEVLRELTEFELDAVAGGDPFSINHVAVADASNNVTSSAGQGFAGIATAVVTQLANVGIGINA